MPLWLLLLGGGIAGAKWGPDLASWLKGKLAPAAPAAAEPKKPARPVYCDPNMSAEACADVASLMRDVASPAVIAEAAASYEAQGFHRAAAALATRAAELAAKGG